MIKPDMSERKESPPDITKEHEKHRRFEIATLDIPRLKTAEELQEQIWLLHKDGSRIDTVVVMEFALQARYTAEHLPELKEIATKSGIDLVLAPENSFRSGDELSADTWADIKSLFETAGATIEDTQYPETRRPDSIGVFIGKDGNVFVFPKNHESPVHKIPNSKIGVTICGEIGNIKPEQLGDIEILYNPAEEHDDVLVRYRMMQEAKGEPLTRKEVEALAMEEGEEITRLLLDEDAYREYRAKLNAGLRKEIGNERYDELFGDEPEIGPDETIEERRKRFDRIIDSLMEHLAGDYDSMYVKTTPGLTEALREKRIPVIRADGMGNSGVLNKINGMQIEDVDVQQNTTRLRITL